MKKIANLIFYLQGGGQSDPGKFKVSSFRITIYDSILIVKGKEYAIWSFWDPD